MDSQSPPPESFSILHYLIPAAIILASNLITHFATRWTERKKSNQDISESAARTDLTTQQTSHTLIESLGEVTTQLRAALAHEKATDVYIELLERQVARARARGYIEEIDCPDISTGNPAGSKPFARKPPVKPPQK